MSRLKTLLSAGQFVVSAEVDPPKNTGLSSLREASAQLRGYVDVVNVADNPGARCHASSWAGSLAVLQEGLEPVLQLTTRDRNRLALQSDLLGAYGLGIRNVLCLSGDHPERGDHPEAQGVWDIDSVQFLKMVRRLRDEKRLMNGNAVNPEPRFFIGAAANPFAEPLRFRVDRLAKKQAAGAEFIQTQPVFDLGRFEEWLSEARERGITRRIHIIAGVMPVTSARTFEYIRDNVPGIPVSQGLIDGLKGAADPVEVGLERAISTARELMRMEGVSGIHVMPLNRHKLVSTIVREVGLFPRPENPAGSD